MNNTIRETIILGINNGDEVTLPSIVEFVKGGYAEVMQRVEIYLREELWKIPSEIQVLVDECTENRLVVYCIFPFDESVQNGLHPFTDSVRLIPSEIGAKIIDFRTE